MDSKQPSAPFLSLVVPAYNEAKRIERSVQDLQSFLRTLPKNTEIILVIEKSSDGTAEIAKRITKDLPNFRVIANDVHLGKGFAVKTGMLQSQGEIVFFMDLDLSTPLVEIFNFLAHFEAHPAADVVIGSRQHAKSQILKRQHPVRQRMGHVFNLFVRAFALSGIEDTQCGFKAFRKKTVKPLFSLQKTHGFSFDVEILLLAQTLGFKTDILPVKWINAADSKVRIVQDSFKMFFDLLKIKKLVKSSLKEAPSSQRK